MKRASIILALSISFFVGHLNSQVVISYFPFQLILSVSSNTENLIWADFRVETNTFFSNINCELNAMVNIKRTDWINCYSGIGVNVNPFYMIENLPLTNGYLLNFGIRVKPIQQHKKLNAIFEISPYCNKNIDGGILRTMIGISYNF